jgi:hypothetical protein
MLSLVSKGNDIITGVNVDVVDNGTKLIGTFYDSRDGSVKDSFTIIKSKYLPS